MRRKPCHSFDDRPRQFRRDVTRSNAWNKTEFRVHNPSLSIGNQNAIVDGVLEKRSIAEAQLSNIAALLAANAEMATRVVQANRENVLIEKINTNISHLISEIANVEFASVPHDVWQWWDRYNETEYQRSKYHRNQILRQPIRRLPRLPVLLYRHRIDHSCILLRRRHQVQTIRGLREIEKILPGDMVLSRDVQTGELCYKPVICGTTRAPSRPSFSQSMMKKSTRLPATFFGFAARAGLKLETLSPVICFTQARNGCRHKVDPRR